MKIKFFLTFLLLTLIYSSVLSQQKKLKFHSINSFGISLGQSKKDILFQSVNGLAFNKFYLGIGFGGDYYQYNSYPLFADVRGYFGKNNEGFAYGDLGYNFNAKNKPGKDIYYNSYDFSGSVYTDIGVGYRTKLFNKSFFTISAGFNFKELKNKISIINECLIAPCPVDYNNYTYGNGKVVLKAGVDF